MNILYDRHETADQIEFEFHFLPLANLIFFLTVVASVAHCCNRTLRVCGILLILWVVGLLPAWIELEKAMSSGSVIASGSKLSFPNPLRVVISKIEGHAQP